MIEYIPPNDEPVIDPSFERINKDLSRADIWRLETGDAAIKYDCNGIHSELIFMRDKDSKYFLLYASESDSKEFVLKSEFETESGATRTVIQNGEEWKLEESFFVEFYQIEKAIKYFLQTGKRCMDLSWSIF